MLWQVNRMAGSRGTRLLIEGLQPCLHVAHLCQSTMLFGIVWVLLSQALAAWRGWGADSAATLLAGCFFLRLRWQWIVLSRLGVALLSFVLVFWCLVCFWAPPLRPSRVVTHATRRRALCTLAGTWEQSQTKILRKPQKFQNSSSYCKLHSRRKISNTSKISNALSARLKLKAQKCQNSILRTLAFLRKLLEWWNRNSSLPPM